MYQLILVKVDLQYFHFVLAMQSILQSLTSTGARDDKLAYLLFDQFVETVLNLFSYVCLPSKSDARLSKIDYIRELAGCPWMTT